MARRARAILATFVAPIVAAGCAGPGGPPFEPDPGYYDVLSSSERARAVEAIAAWSAGEREAALEGLEAVRRTRPHNLAVATLAQELELELALAGAETEADALDAREELRRAYRERAEERSSAESLVLAARLEDDDTAALRLLERALDVDPFCVWAYYASAFVHARAGSYVEARDDIDVALEIDPGHMPTRRLEATLLARAGDHGRAARVLDGWVHRAPDHAVLAPGAYQDAVLDLASLRVILGEPEEARDRIGHNPFDAEGAARAQMIRAVARQDEESGERALRQARGAAQRAPEDPLPWVQIAILSEHVLGDLEAAREAWREVLARAEARAEEDPAGWLGEGERELAFESILIVIQARVELERIEERLAAR